jgi:CheY-like chemotaxis protein
MNRSSPQRRPKIMVVDDDQVALELRSQLLEIAGCDVVSVMSPSDAEALLTGGQAIDLVMTDIHFGEADPRDRSGIALAQHLKTKYPDVPIVGYSAMYSGDDIPSADSVLFDAFIAKGGSASLADSLDRAVTLATHHLEQRVHANAIELDSGEANVAIESEYDQ